MRRIKRCAHGRSCSTVRGSKKSRGRVVGKSPHFPTDDTAQPHMSRITPTPCMPGHLDFEWWQGRWERQQAHYASSLQYSRHRQRHYADELGLRDDQRDLDELADVEGNIPISQGQNRLDCNSPVPVHWPPVQTDKTLTLQRGERGRFMDARV